MSEEHEQHLGSQPIGDPTPFLQERIEALYEQAEIENPGGPHDAVKRFEELSDDFLSGSPAADRTLCLYAMTLYLQNPDKLVGTDAGWSLSTFANDFSLYTGMSEGELGELWEDAQWCVAQSDRLERVHKKMRGEIPLFSIPVKVVRLSNDSSGELQTEQVYPPTESK